MSKRRQSQSRLSQGVRTNNSAAATPPATGALLIAVVDISPHNGEIDLARAKRSLVDHRHNIEGSYGLA
jgi:hypothetical protein